MLSHISAETMHCLQYYGQRDSMRYIVCGVSVTAAAANLARIFRLYVDARIDSESRNFPTSTID